MERNRTLFSKIAYFCFYAGIVSEVLIVLVDKSAYINPIEGQLFRLTFFLFLIKVCLTKYSRKEYLLIFLFCVLGVISYFTTERNEVLRLVIMIVACKDIDMKKCLKLVFYLTLAGCMVIMLLSLTGIMGTVALTQDYGRGSVETRYTLGMGHPNALHCMVWTLIVLHLYLYGEKMKWYHYLIPMGVNILFFQLTDSKTSMLVTTLTILMAGLIVCSKSELIKKLCVWAGYLAAVFSVGISVIIAANAYRIHDYYWENDRTKPTMFFYKLNEILNGRILILVENDGFEGTTGTWSLFSRPENNYFFDLGWVRLFYWFGIIPACVFLAALVLLMIYCYRKRDYMAAVMIVSISVYTVIEAHVFSDYLARNYLFFLMGAYWYQILPANNKDKVSTLHEG